MLSAMDCWMILGQKTEIGKSNNFTALMETENTNENEAVAYL